MSLRENTRSKFYLFEVRKSGRNRSTRICTSSSRGGMSKKRSQQKNRGHERVHYDPNHSDGDTPSSFNTMGAAPVARRVRPRLSATVRIVFLRIGPSMAQMKRSKIGISKVPLHPRTRTPARSSTRLKFDREGVAARLRPFWEGGRQFRPVVTFKGWTPVFRRVTFGVRGHRCFADRVR